MKRLQYIISGALLTATLLLGACKSGRTYFPDNVEPADVPIVRFDQAVLALSDVTDSASLRAGVRALYKEYPDVMGLWMEEILGIMAEDSVYLCEVLPQFFQDTTYGFRETNARCKELFADISDIQSELNEAFGRMRTFSDYGVPPIYFFISGFNASIFGIEEMIAVGVDMYLGSDYPYYNRVVYEYQKQTMRKECIPVDVVSYFLFNHVPFTSDQYRLLDNMVYRGKIMFVTSLLFPKETPWEVMGYTKEQWDWCVRNERAVWGLMMDKKDLYKTEPLVLTSYLNDGPFTSEISQQSPGRLGTWVGWRIVESYMKHHPEVSLRDLLEEGDAQKILEQSYYKP